MRYGFGVDLGGTTVKIAFFDEEGTLLEKWEIPTATEGGGSQILPDIAAAIGAFVEERRIPRESLLGIGIGVPGPVNDRGIVSSCVNLGWGETDIPKQLGQLTGLPVQAGNDASVAALGECWMGSGRGCRSMVLATLGTGVGGGIVVDGKVVHGVRGAAGEIGHMVLNRHETQRCNCGKYGCVEQYCSATGIVRLAKQHLDLVDAPSVLRSAENLTCKEIFDAGAAGDRVALEVLEQVYAYMGEFLANVCLVTDPEMVVLGGGVSKAGQPLLDGAKRYFDQFVLPACRDTQFRLASLGNDAGAYGAFKLILE